MMALDVIKIAAFSDGNSGGNPAGVVITDSLPDAETMQAVAADVGFSETVFVAALDGSNKQWLTRYYSPESEVPFCGHATIALGAALAENYGGGEFALQLSAANISVSGEKQGELYSAALQSPATKSAALKPPVLNNALQLFGYSDSDIDPQLKPAHIHAGADHLVIPLKNRQKLSAMDYDLAAGKIFMREEGLVTVMFVAIENDTLFHVRNAFASGGVLEDPATGAAAAAFSGYLRDVNWPHGGSIEIIQGEDMGLRSLLFATIGDEIGGSIRVSGTARLM